MNYAAFVEEVAPLRAADLDLELSPTLRDQVVVLAGVMYVRDLIAGQLALAELATGQSESTVASTRVKGLRIGREDLTRSSPYIRQLRTLRDRTTEQLRRAGVPATTRRLSDLIILVARADER